MILAAADLFDVLQVFNKNRLHLKRRLYLSLPRRRKYILLPLRQLLKCPKHVHLSPLREYEHPLPRKSDLSHLRPDINFY